MELLSQTFCQPTDAGNPIKKFRYTSNDLTSTNSFSSLTWGSSASDDPLDFQEVSSGVVTADWLQKQPATDEAASTLALLQLRTPRTPAQHHFLKMPETPRSFKRPPAEFAWTTTPIGSGADGPTGSSSSPQQTTGRVPAILLTAADTGHIPTLERSNYNVPLTSKPVARRLVDDSFLCKGLFVYTPRPSLGISICANSPAGNQVVTGMSASTSYT